MKRISCSDLALGFAYNKIIEAETDDEVLEQALAHARRARAGRCRQRALAPAADR